MPFVFQVKKYLSTGVISGCPSCYRVKISGYNLHHDLDQWGANLPKPNQLGVYPSKYNQWGANLPKNPTNEELTYQNPTNEELTYQKIQPMRSLPTKIQPMRS